MQPGASRAIELLEKMQASLGSSYLAYWALPNIILTLSGARSYCDGVYWSENQAQLEQWNNEIAESLTALKSLTTVVASSNSIEPEESKDQHAYLEIILEDGLKYCFNNTELLPSSPHLHDEDLSVACIINKLKSILRKNNNFSSISDENLHHVAFGILVGYPDAAISESVLSWDQNDPFAEPHINADIRGASYYVCPQPVYSYPRHLVNDPVINDHEQLWSQILKDYYSSDFHKQLAANSDFIDKMNELKNFN